MPTDFAGKFDCEADFIEFVDGKMTKRHMFMFNNLLLVTKEYAKGKHELKHSFPLDKCLLWDNVSTSDAASFQLVLTDSPDKIVMMFPSNKLKETIMEKIHEAMASGCK